MPRTYTLIHPDIDAGSGRTRELIEELSRSWQEGTSQGGREIGAVVNLLASDESLPEIAFRARDGGAVQRLGKAFADLLARRCQPGPFLKRYLREGGHAGIEINTAGLGSATGALFASLAAAGVAGGEVITASLNYVGVPNAIVLAGATPRFVDIDERTWCMDPAAVAKAITKKTRAILLTHLNRSADLEPFFDLLKGKASKIPLIQDASLAVGSSHQGLPAGVINIGPGSATVFSLATSKVLSGLGGAVVSACDAETLRRIVTIGYQGMCLADPGTLDSHGANLKMNDLNAAIAMEQLKRADAIFEHRRRIKARYDELLAPAAEEGRIVLQDTGDETVVTHYAVLLPDRDTIARRLHEEHRINLGMWHLHHRQAIYRGCSGELPRTDALEGRFTFLPFHTRLADEDISFICKKLLGVLRR